MLSIKRCVQFCVLVALFPFLLKIANNANMTLFDRSLTLEDRVISFVLSFPGVLPMALPTVKDNAEGRKLIESQRKHFNWLVNSAHDSQAAAMNYTTQSLSVPTRDGVTIEVVLYRPSYLQSGSTNPLYVWIHGGGWVYGEARDVLLLDSLPQCEVSTSSGKKNNLIVASIEYRLAPEAKFPTATDDTIDALKWLVQHADELGVDRNRVSIGGTSAGGNLAAVLGQRAVEEGIQLKFQAIFLPVVHYGCTSYSCLSHAGVPLLGAQEIVWFHSMYARSWRDGLHRYYNPLLFSCEPGPASSARLAPALVVTAGQDAVRDDGVDYVTYLRNSCRVEVSHEEVPGTHWSFYRPPRHYLATLQRGLCG